MDVGWVVENFKPEEKKEGRPTLGGTGAGGSRASETLKPCYALMIGLKDHKGPGPAAANPVRVKVTTAEWVYLWRLWDQAVRVDSPADSIDKYNRYAKSLVEKYNVQLEPNQTVEFT